MFICWRYGVQRCIQDAYWVGVEIEGSNPPANYQRCPPLPHLSPYCNLAPVWINGHVLPKGELPSVQFSFETEEEAEERFQFQAGQSLYWANPRHSLRSFNSWYMNRPVYSVVDGTSSSFPSSLPSLTYSLQSISWSASMNSGPFAPAPSLCLLAVSSTSEYSTSIR